MQQLRFALILLVAALSVQSGTFAEELQPGVQYVGETTLESTELGASFLLPQGWIGQLPAGSEVFIMQSQSFEAYVFAGLEEMTVEEARSVMSQPIDVGQGVVLQPKGPVKIEGRLLSADYTVSGAQSPLIGRVATVVGNHGLGFSLIAASAPGDAAALHSTLATIIASVTLRQPVGGAATPPTSSGGGAWVAELTGRKLSHFFTRTGYTEEDYIWLCPNGRFFKSFNSGGFGGGASGAFESENAGRWSVSGGLEGGSLDLAYNDGSTATYTVTHEHTKLFLDGKRYFREATNCN